MTEKGRDFDVWTNGRYCHDKEEDEVGNAKGGEFRIITIPKQKLREEWEV